MRIYRGPLYKGQGPCGCLGVLGGTPFKVKPFPDFFPERGACVEANFKPPLPLGLQAGPPNLEGKPGHKVVCLNQSRPAGVVGTVLGPALMPWHRARGSAFRCAGLLASWPGL